MATHEASSERSVPTGPPDSEVLSNQSQFRQKASNPQASLQPWLDQLLDANGLVRCYATEDANPTKQLKNKLSQAAAARDGLLVLLLADESAFLKAREALLERWMTNVEWPKSVASVALAFPVAAPAVVALIERSESPWARRVHSRLFPSAEVIRITGGLGDERSSSVGTRCLRCGADLPIAARFCPGCGTAVSVAGANDLNSNSR